MFEVCGLSISTAHRTIEDIRRCAELLLEESQISVGSLSSSMAPPDPKLLMLSKYLSRVFRAGTREACIQAANDYKVYICDEELLSKDKFYKPPAAAAAFTKKKRVLNYW